jgi:hypothetical protein
VCAAEQQPIKQQIEKILHVPALAGCSTCLLELPVQNLKLICRKLLFLIKCGNYERRQKPCGDVETAVSLLW